MNMKLNHLKLLKHDLINATVQAIDENIPFTVETGSEQYHSSVEKEAQAIVESINHWQHFLLGRHFMLITDQRSVTYMYDTKNSSKIKNDKVLHWRVELSPYSYDIHYRLGKYNVAADNFTCVNFATISSENLYSLHPALCHPSITRLHHSIHSRNLAYSLENIRHVCNNC